MQRRRRRKKLGWGWGGGWGRKQRAGEEKENKHTKYNIIISTIPICKHHRHYILTFDSPHVIHLIQYFIFAGLYISFM